jgi:hypothetical protein
MIRIIFLTLIYILSGLCQSEFGVIDDPDEYTNIRMNRNTKSSISRRVLKGEVFEFYKNEKKDWFYVTTQNEISGYMHKSRIKKIDKSIYDNCSYYKPKNPTKDPNFIFKTKSSIISFCGEVDKDHSFYDEIKLYGVEIKNCKTGQNVYLGDFRYCIFKNINNKLRIFEVDRLPAGINWEWKDDVIIGEIIINKDNFKRITKLDTKITKKELNDYYNAYKAGEVFEDFEVIVSKAYVGCLIGDQRYFNMLNEFEYSDGSVRALWYSYSNYLKERNFTNNQN